MLFYLDVCVVKNIKKLNLFVVILIFFPTFAEFYKFNL